MKLECCRYQKKRRDHGFSVLAQFLRPADGLDTRNKGKYFKREKDFGSHVASLIRITAFRRGPPQLRQLDYGPPSWGHKSIFRAINTAVLGDWGMAVRREEACDRSSRSVWRLVLLRRSFAAIFRLCWPSRLTRQPSLIRRLSSFTTPGDTRTPFPSRSGYWLYAKRRSVAIIPMSQRR